jgi:glutamate racemase
MSSDRPIGVFDSGLGGLTVVAALVKRMPHESILYLGDTARLPYGTKSPETVQSYTKRNLSFLSNRGVKAVVVACNTASALALGNIQTELPTWGVIDPGAQRAAAVSRGRIGVIATESTTRSQAYPLALRALRPELEIMSVACPLLVPLVEESWLDDPISTAITARYLEPLLQWGMDTLVLGCTHYPLLRNTFRDLVGSEVTLVDSAEVVAAKIDVEMEASIRAAQNQVPEHHFCITDAGENFARMARGFLDDNNPSLELVEVT